ncbi:MAG: NUDIX hydrolase [Actinocatenispora sp.]
MNGEKLDYAVRYPLLHAPQRWDWGDMDALFATAPPADELVTNVHVVGFVGDRIVVCEDTRPVWFLPGGTREEHESVHDCVVRELREEAGASLAGPLHVIGAHRCRSDRPEPFRPWQPHPDKAWLWCYADVRVDGPPTNPPDGEQVVDVHVADPDEAQRLVSSEGPWMPELVALARELRSASA